MVWYSLHSQILLTFSTFQLAIWNDPSLLQNTALLTLKSEYSHFNFFLRQITTHRAITLFWLRGLVHWQALYVITCLGGFLYVLCVIGRSQMSCDKRRVEQQFIYLFIYLGFYVAFNTVQVISRRVVGRAGETST